MNVERYVIFQLNKEYKRLKRAGKDKIQALTFMWIGQEERLFPKIPKLFVGIQLKRLSEKGIIKLYMSDLTILPDFFNWLDLEKIERKKFLIPIILDSLFSTIALILSIIALVIS